MAKIETTKVHFLDAATIVGVAKTGFTMPANPNKSGMGTAIKTNYNIVLADGRRRRVLALMVPHVEPQHYVLIKDIRHFLTPECHARMEMLEPFGWPIDPYGLDDFMRGYMDAALWSSNDDDGDSLDAEYDIGDFHPTALAQIVIDCTRFQRDNAELLEAAYIHPKYYSRDGSTVESLAGHDFWFTRNGHGAGFWDGDLSPWGDENDDGESRDIGQLLSDACKRYREIDLYAHNGKVYAQ